MLIHYSIFSNKTLNAQFFDTVVNTTLAWDHEILNSNMLVYLGNMLAGKHKTLIAHIFRTLLPTAQACNHKTLIAHVFDILVTTSQV